jgi:hypothetical protein
MRLLSRCSMLGESVPQLILFIYFVQLRLRVLNNHLLALQANSWRLLLVSLEHLSFLTGLVRVLLLGYWAVLGMILGEVLPQDCLTARVLDRLNLGGWHIQIGRTLVLFNNLVRICHLQLSILVAIWIIMWILLFIFVLLLVIFNAILYVILLIIINILIIVIIVLILIPFLILILVLVLILIWIFKFVRF